MFRPFYIRYYVSHIFYFFHFYSTSIFFFCLVGRPADPEDVNNPDWVPSVKMGYKRSHPESENDCRRFKRFKKKVLADLENVMPEGESEYEQCDSYIAEDTETKKGIATETTFENIIKWEEGYKKVPMLEEKISCLERENQSLRKELSARNEEIFKLQDRVHALILIEQSMRKTRKR